MNIQKEALIIYGLLSNSLVGVSQEYDDTDLTYQAYLILRERKYYAVLKQDKLNGKAVILIDVIFGNKRKSKGVNVCTVQIVNKVLNVAIKQSV